MLDKDGKIVYVGDKVCYREGGSGPVKVEDVTMDNQHSFDSTLITKLTN